MKSTSDRPRTANLRHRLFLVVESFIAPVAGARTERKGWMQDRRNLDSTEQPHIVTRITTKHLIRADIIIDLFQDQLIKNRLGGGTAETLEHFKTQYADLIRRSFTGLVRKVVAR